MSKCGALMYKKTTENNFSREKKEKIIKLKQNDLFERFTGLSKKLIRVQIRSSISQTIYSVGSNFKFELKTSLS